MGITEILGGIVVLIVGAFSAFLYGKNKGKTEQKVETENKVLTKKVENIKTTKDVENEISRINTSERDALAKQWMRNPGTDGE